MAAIADALATALLLSGASRAEDLARTLRVSYLLIKTSGATITTLGAFDA